MAIWQFKQNVSGLFNSYVVGAINVSIDTVKVHKYKTLITFHNLRLELLNFEDDFSLSLAACLLSCGEVFRVPHIKTFIILCLHSTLSTLYNCTTKQSTLTDAWAGRFPVTKRTVLHHPTLQLVIMQGDFCLTEQVNTSTDTSASDTFT